MTEDIITYDSYDLCKCGSQMPPDQVECMECYTNRVRDMIRRENEDNERTPKMS